MSYVKPVTIGWDHVNVSDLSHYAVYIGPVSETDYILRAEARQVEPHGTTAENKYVLNENSGLAEGDYQVGVRTVDTRGNMSDVYQADVWKNVPLDLTPPPAPTNGTLS